MCSGEKDYQTNAVIHDAGAVAVGPLRVSSNCWGNHNAVFSPAGALTAIRLTSEGQVGRFEAHTVRKGKAED